MAASAADTVVVVEDGEHELESVEAAEEDEQAQAGKAGPSLACIMSERDRVPHPAAAVAVYTIGHPPNWREEELFYALAFQKIGSLIDARPAGGTVTVPQLRRRCAASGMTYNWQPILSSSSSSGSNVLEASDGCAASGLTYAGARATLLFEAASCRRPCVLFSGAAWDDCPSRRRLACELRLKGMDALLAGTPSGMGRQNPVRGRHRHTGEGSAATAGGA
eukprot:gnl/TRDRNA2_/TRDRNA2_167343_c0_seq1.p1 gnl/TRDRNA2_/TRDRNA2_167343_c0~~gnl/TRDRNA2_/TRDRNA2_167343_c0_seq1.p1  ORF type:complete len:239 (+),score=40.18 gnl/TRDRNA2_/TRDRNA2_167343_c0_seq1:55-717(+)